MTGEFEKRIKRHGLESLIVICPHDTVGECDCLVRWILDIVGEAKKEYPKDLLRSGNILAADKWFVKWFGE